jgi:hypothetical protein
MRLGDSDRGLARAGIIGRKKAGRFRLISAEQGWLALARPIPAPEQLAVIIAPSRPKPATSSMVEPYREQVLALAADSSIRKGLSQFFL